MRTKFINIPKDKRTATRTRARDSLLHWKANLSPDAKRFIQSSDINGEFALYRLHKDTVYLYYQVEGGMPTAIEFVWVDEELKHEVHFDVTKQPWTRKLFFELMGKKSTTDLLEN